MRHWLIFAIALVLTVGILFATVTIGIYEKEPLYKPYWENKAARDSILQDVAAVGIKVRDGDLGVVVVGFRDQIDAANRAELLSALNEVIKVADGYTVYLLPWATDNATRGFLASLYRGDFAAGDYLKGLAANITATDERLDKAYELVKTITNTYGSYRPLGGNPYSITPPIFVAVFRKDTTYVVYEPFTIGRDSTYRDWLIWVKTAFENLKKGQGKVTP